MLEALFLVIGMVYYFILGLITLFALFFSIVMIAVSVEIMGDKFRKDVPKKKREKSERRRKIERFINTALETIMFILTFMMVGAVVHYMFIAK